MEHAHLARMKGTGQLSENSAAAEFELAVQLGEGTLVVVSQWVKYIHLDRSFELDSL